jgi:hypothetical protein
VSQQIAGIDAEAAERGLEVLDQLIEGVAGCIAGVAGAPVAALVWGDGAAQLREGGDVLAPVIA